MGLKRFSLKRKAVVTAAIILATASMGGATIPAHAGQASVTWSVVDQGINSNNKYVYDGDKTDSTMTSLVVKKGSENKYGYIDRGEVRSTGSIVVGNWDGWWHVVNGWVDTSTGVADTTSGKIKFVNGRMETTANKTLEKSDSDGWLYMVDGIFDSSYTGLATNTNGVYWVTNGKWDTSKTGFVTDTAGIVKKGAKLYIENGSFDGSGDNDYEDGVKQESSGVWYKVRNGIVDDKFCGLAKNSNGWWYVQNGKVNFSYTGVASNENGTYYVKNGKCTFDYNGYYGGYYFSYGTAIGTN